MDYVNSVRLVGRVSTPGEPRVLPSGDTVHPLRVVVPREARRDRDQTEQEKEARAHMKFPETMESAGVVSSKPRQRFRAKHV